MSAAATRRRYQAAMGEASERDVRFQQEIDRMR